MLFDHCAAVLACASLGALLHLLVANAVVRLGGNRNERPAAAAFGGRSAGATTASLEWTTAPPEHVPCRLVPDRVKSALLAKDPFAVNELRRNLATDAPACLTRHLELFASAFLDRMDRPRPRRHLTLHIPKTGGTALCDAVKKSGKLTTVGHNCWTGEFCPLWCGCADPTPASCDALDQIPYDFVMNENWLDGFCPGNADEDDNGAGRVYSILIREPVSRAISHVNHLLDAIAARGHEHFHDTKNWRLNLAQSNYLTWSLSYAAAVAATTAAISNSTATAMPQSRFFRPREENLYQAQRALRRMDFIVDLAYPDRSCTSAVLGWMGIDTSTKKNGLIGRSNSYGDAYKDGFDVRNYELMNSLDIRLYGYATDLLRADCEFFKLVVGRQNPSSLRS